MAATLTSGCLALGAAADGSGMAFRVIRVPGAGAEDVVVATAGPDEGAVFTGTEDGAIQRISHDGRRVEQVADTGGRPLGAGTY